MFSLTGMTERGIIAAQGPCPEEFVFEAWGLVGRILKKFPFLRTCCEIVESHSAFGSFPRRCLLQGKQIANLYWGWLAPILDMI